MPGQQIEARVEEVIYSGIYTGICYGCDHEWETGITDSPRMVCPKCNGGNVDLKTKKLASRIFICSLVLIKNEQPE
jgi:hypothetical protein